MFGIFLTIQGNNQTVLCQPAREFLPMIDEVGFFFLLFTSLLVFFCQDSI